MITPAPSAAICEHCNGPIAQRNPSGYCDHLHYPEGCSICSAGEFVRTDTSAVQSGQSPTKPDASTEMQKLVEYIERTECTVNEGQMKKIIAYIRTLEAEHARMKKELFEISETAVDIASLAGSVDAEKKMCQLAWEIKDRAYSLYISL